MTKRARWAVICVAFGACGDAGGGAEDTGYDIAVPTPDVEVAAPHEVDAGDGVDGSDVVDVGDSAEVAAPASLVGPCVEAPIETCDGEVACVRWKLMGIEVPPSGGDARFAWQIEAHCDGPLDEVLFAFDPGVDRLTPLDGELYTSPEGSTWRASRVDEGCAGFRMVREGAADADGKTTFVLTAQPASVATTTVFVNRARAGTTVAGFATRATSCFVFQEP